MDVFIQKKHLTAEYAENAEKIKKLRAMREAPHRLLKNAKTQAKACDYQKEKRPDFINVAAPFRVRLLITGPFFNSLLKGESCFHFKPLFFFAYFAALRDQLPFSGSLFRSAGRFRLTA